MRRSNLKTIFVFLCRRNDIQHNDIHHNSPQHNNKHTTFSIYNIRHKETQHNNSVLILGVAMLSVVFFNVMLVVVMVSVVGSLCKVVFSTSLSKKKNVCQQI